MGMVLKINFSPQVNGSLYCVIQSKIVIFPVSLVQRIPVLYFIMWKYCKFLVSESGNSNCLFIYLKFNVQIQFEHNRSVYKNVFKSLILINYILYVSV
jgi:hypothetical protein